MTRMNSFARRVQRLVAHGVVGLLGFGAIACAASAPVALTPTLPAATPSATMTVSNAPTRYPPTRTPISPSSAITLTWWTTQEFAPSDADDELLWRNQFFAFLAANPNIHIDIVLKKPYGKGGLLDFLTTTNTVAPAQLPDLVTLDLAEVGYAAQAGVLQPLDQWLPGELKSDLFPFASQAAQYQNQWVAMPFTADIQHLVYARDVVKQPPQTWDDLLRQKNSIALPLGGDDAFLMQYIAMTDWSTSTAQLDWSAMTLILNFFKRARDQGLLNDATPTWKNTSETWAAFIGGQAPLAQISASQFLSKQARPPNTSFARMITRDGRASTVASGWAISLIAKDTIRQAAAAHFIQWMTTPDRIAPWLRASHRLSPSHAPLIQAVESADYFLFTREQLERAVYVRRTPFYDKASEAWRTAITNVWKGQTTPEEAARVAVMTAR